MIITKESDLETYTWVKCAIFQWYGINIDDNWEDERLLSVPFLMDEERCPFILCHVSKSREIFLVKMNRENFTNHTDRCLGLLEDQKYHDSKRV